ncbi:protein kinase [Klebsiella phage vB_KpnP_BIS33]|uniref:Protein kinase n=1 Tax=Klebsiella phage vB_KpnP_BIS33 TaxID=1907782 RepID=A0A1V0E6E9_9CAUD|nr:serine-threonine kinase [Klebsiella phage vB_KpnP_BIS33]ARB12462.1 protein kinase [Klebsiella phage vB_KpnP_BIS33]
MTPGVLKVDFAKVEERILAWQVVSGLAIQMGKPLPIDNYLQGRLMG